MAEEKQHPINQNDEIDLVELVKTIWSGHWLIAKTGGLFLLIGVIIAFASPIEYAASCKLLPESQKAGMKNVGGLAGLAGLAGVDLSNLSGGSGVLKPDLYPQLANSLPFILEVINDSIYFEQRKSRMTSFYYFKEIAKPSMLDYVKRYTIGLPKKLKGLFITDEITDPKASEYYRLSKSDWKVVEKFRDRISINIKDKLGIIEVDVVMPDPYAAAEIAKKIEVELTKSVINYKTDKAVKNLQFVQKAYDDAKIRFEALQLKFARARDRNVNVNTSIAKIELEKIEHEFEIAFDVYKGLASQVEQAKISVKEETPVFTVLEPVRIPNDKASPKRAVILIVSIIAGIFFSVFYVLVKKYFLTSFFQAFKN